MFGSWVWDKDNPKAYGPGAGSWLHILFIILTAISIFLLVRFLSKKHDYKTENLITRIYCASLITLEVVKQILNINVYNMRFKWNSLSFYLCSIPIYTSFISSLISNPKNKTKIFCDDFNVYFGFLGGISLLILPTQVLETPYVFKSFHGLTWHSLMVIYVHIKKNV